MSSLTEKRKRMCIAAAAAAVLAAAVLCYAFWVRGVGIFYLAKCFARTYDALGDGIQITAANLGYRRDVRTVSVESENLEITFSDGIAIRDRRAADVGDAPQTAQGGDVSDFADEVMDNYRVTKDFFYSLKVSKAPSEDLLTGGKKLRCSVYDVQCDPQKTAEYIRHMKMDETQKFLIDRAGVILDTVNRQLNLSIPPSTIEKIIQNITPDTSHLADCITDGIRLKVYLYEQKVVKAAMSLALSDLAVSEISLEIALGGGKLPVNTCDLHFGAVVGEKKLYLEIGGRGDIKENAAAMAYTITTRLIYDHTEALALTATADYADKKLTLDGKYTVLMETTKLGGAAEITAGDTLQMDYADRSGGAVTVLCSDSRG